MTKSQTVKGAAREATARARLLAAARDLTVEIGLSATTTRATSERAGANTALVYDDIRLRLAPLPPPPRQRRRR